MIRINTPEEFQEWLKRGNSRAPKLYGDSLGGRSFEPKEANSRPLQAIPKPSHKPWMPPPPPKESEDWDGIEPEVIDEEII